MGSLGGRRSRARAVSRSCPELSTSWVLNSGLLPESGRRFGHPHQPRAAGRCNRGPSTRTRRPSRVRITHIRSCWSASLRRGTPRSALPRPGWPRRNVESACASPSTASRRWSTSTYCFPTRRGLERGRREAVAADRQIGHRPRRRPRSGARRALPVRDHAARGPLQRSCGSRLRAPTRASLRFCRSRRSAPRTNAGRRAASVVDTLPRALRRAAHCA